LAPTVLRSSQIPALLLLAREWLVLVLRLVLVVLHLVLVVEHLDIWREELVQV
jgi:hypothetical protein